MRWCTVPGTPTTTPRLAVAATCLLSRPIQYDRGAAPRRRSTTLSCPMDRARAGRVEFGRVPPRKRNPLDLQGVTPCVLSPLAAGIPLLSFPFPLWWQACAPGPAILYWSCVSVTPRRKPVTTRAPPPGVCSFLRPPNPVAWPGQTRSGRSLFANFPYQAASARLIRPGR